jgi:hypothetical protein
MGAEGLGGYWRGMEEIGCAVHHRLSARSVTMMSRAWRELRRELYPHDGACIWYRTGL